LEVLEKSISLQNNRKEILTKPILLH